MVLFRIDTIQEMSFKSQSEITHSWATYVISVLHVILHLWVIDVFQHRDYDRFSAAISLAGFWSEFEQTITMRFSAITISAHGSRKSALTRVFHHWILFSAHVSRYGAISVRYNPGNVIQKPVRNHSCLVCVSQFCFTSDSPSKGRIPSMR